MIDVQRAVDTDAVSNQQLSEAASAVLAREGIDGALTLRLVDSDEMRALNARFRGKDQPTNVLSFAQDVQDEQGVALLGDVILCVPVIDREAHEQGKTPGAHYQHMAVHGTLHLLGYDHIDDKDARHMEQLERDVLASLGVSDPYTWPTGPVSTDTLDRTALDV